MPMEFFLTVDEIAKMLRVSRVWVYKSVRQRKIPFYHVERVVRFSPSEIKEWLEERHNKPWKRDRNKARYSNTDERPPD